jgi:hypothetical protein
VTNLCNNQTCTGCASSCSVPGTYVTVTVTPKTAYKSFVSYGLFSISPTIGGFAAVRIQ